MGGRQPGPICSARLGADWIDQGTMCLTRSSPPGPIGVRDDHVGAQGGASKPDAASGT